MNTASYFLRKREYLTIISPYFGIFIMSFVFNIIPHPDIHNIIIRMKHPAIFRQEVSFILKTIVFYSATSVGIQALRTF